MGPEGPQGPLSEAQQAAAAAALQQQKLQLKKLQEALGPDAIEVRGEETKEEKETVLLSPLLQKETVSLLLSLRLMHILERKPDKQYTFRV